MNMNPTTNICRATITAASTAGSFASQVRVDPPLAPEELRWQRLDSVLDNPASTKFAEYAKRPEFGGYGYIGGRRALLDVDESECDPRLVAVADTYLDNLGLTDAELFGWANSKAGRYFADELYDLSADGESEGRAHAVAKVAERYGPFGSLSASAGAPKIRWNITRNGKKLPRWITAHPQALQAAIDFESTDEA